MPHIHAVVSDLFFAERIGGALRQLGYEATVDDLSDGVTPIVSPTSSLLLVDLEGGEMALAAVSAAKSNGIPVLAFGPHTDLALRQAALAAGADQVVAKSKLTSSLPELVAAMIAPH